MIPLSGEAATRAGSVTHHGLRDRQGSNSWRFRRTSRTAAGITAAGPTQGILAANATQRRRFRRTVDGTTGAIMLGFAAMLASEH